MKKLLNYIVKRMNGEKFGAPEFYWWVKENLAEEDAEPILNAIDAQDENAVKEAIFEHFSRHKLYPLALAYVRAVKWLDDDPEESTEVEVAFFVPTLNKLTGKEEQTEVYYTYQADARLRTREQLHRAYRLALRAGARPTDSVMLELEHKPFGDYKPRYMLDSVKVTGKDGGNVELKLSYLERVPDVNGYEWKGATTMLHGIEFGQPAKPIETLGRDNYEGGICKL